MSQTHTGRHRSGSYSALSELADIASRSAGPAVKASAVAVASGGLVASFAMPAHAAQATPTSSSAASDAAVVAPAASAALVSSLTAPQAAAAEAPLVAQGAVSAAAVVAPTTKAAVNTTASMGVLGFTATKAASKTPTMKVTKLVQEPAATTATTTTGTTATTTSRSSARSTSSSSSSSTSSSSSSSSATRTVPAASSGIIAIAASLSGIPYVYGGSTPSGFDCSGYTSYVYRQAGKSIPRTAEAQRSASTKVSNPSPGDLIFFGFPAYHVGIYAGGGKLYDAQHPGTVTGLHSIWTYSNVSYGRF